MFFALKLVGRGGAQRGVEGDVVAALARGSRLNVTAMLAFGARAAASALDAACQPVERRVQAAWGEFVSRFNAFAAVPPMGVLRLVKDILRRGRRFRVADVGVGLTGGIGQPLTFFSASPAPSAGEGSSVASDSS